MSKASKVFLIEWNTLSHFCTALCCLGCAHECLKAAAVVCFCMNDLIFLWVRGICDFHPVSPFRLSLVDLWQQPSALSGAQLSVVPNRVWVGEKAGLVGFLWISKRRINCRGNSYTQGLSTHLVILLTICPE